MENWPENRLIGGPEIRTKCVRTRNKRQNERTAATKDLRTPDRLRAKSYFGKQKKRNPETSDPFPGAIRKIRLHRNYHACITDFFHPPQRTGRCLHKILVGMNIQIECKAYRKAALTEGGGNCGSGNPNETPWRSDKENRTQVPYQTPVEIINPPILCFFTAFQPTVFVHTLQM